MILRFFQFAFLLIEIFPKVLKAWRAWEAYNDEKLTRRKRRAAAEKVKAALDEAIATKDTSNLEALLRGTVAQGEAK